MEDTHKTYMGTVGVYVLKDAHSLWDDVNNSHLWQDLIFHSLSILYAFLSLIALVQSVRIQCRVPQYGWTTQKVFHFLHFVVAGVRCLVFVFRRNVQNLKSEAHEISTNGLRRSFYTINAIVYAIQIILWLILCWKPIPVLIILSKLFFAGVSLFTALGSLLYGERLFTLLEEFPVESKGRRNKLHEVRSVTTICFTCFLIRSIMICWNAFDKAADLDVLDHPILNFIYYLLVEILPCSLVLYIPRKLPPKRRITQYNLIR